MTNLLGLPDPNPMLDLLQRLPVFRPGYDIGVSLIEPLVAFVLQPGYEMAHIGRPLPSDLPIPANGVWEDTIAVAPGSWLVAMTFGIQERAGAVNFKFSLYDTVAKRFLFNRDAMASCIAGGAGNQRQPYYLPKPLPILGTLNLVLTNLDPTNANDMQLLLWIAVPTDPTKITAPNQRVIT